MAASSPPLLTLSLPAGKLGVGIRVRAADGMCVVASKSKSNPDSPLEVNDVVVSMNGVELKNVEAVDTKLNSWIKLFEAFANGPRTLVVRREEKNNADGARDATSASTAGNANATAKDGSCERPGFARGNDTDEPLPVLKKPPTSWEEVEKQRNVLMNSTGRLLTDEELVEDLMMIYGLSKEAATECAKWKKPRGRPGRPRANLRMEVRTGTAFHSRMFWSKRKADKVVEDAHVEVAAVEDRDGTMYARLRPAWTTVEGEVWESFDRVRRWARPCPATGCKLCDEAKVAAEAGSGTVDDADEAMTDMTSGGCAVKAKESMEMKKAEPTAISAEASSAKKSVGNGDVSYSSEQMESWKEALEKRTGREISDKEVGQFLKDAKKFGEEAEKATAATATSNAVASSTKGIIESTRKRMAKMLGHEWTDEEVVRFIKHCKTSSDEAKAAKAQADAFRALKITPPREDVMRIRNCMLNVTGRELDDDELAEMLMDKYGVSREVATECAEKYQLSKEGHVSPLDIVAQKDKYPALFEEFVGFSNRFKDTIKDSSKDQKRWRIDANGHCLRILDADFTRTLEPFTEEEQEQTPFTNDSTVNRFGHFLEEMFRAAETGSTGGDACRQNRVLLAVLSDVEKIRNNKERIEHLLGITIAIRVHGLYATLTRGHPPLLKDVFKGLADMWRPYFDPKYGHSWLCYNLCDRFKETADDHCKALQDMLKTNKKEHGPYVENYNFNYKRIPRPRKANAKENDEISTNENAGGKRKAGEGGGKSTKKKRKPTAADKLIERVLAVENVPEDRVYDSAPELRRKIKEFLRREGMTKTKLCEALGNINHNSLNRFLNADGQNQSGNQAYQKGYIFFEKLRILEGKAKSDQRVANEQQMPDGFDITKSKGGSRPSYIFPASWF